MDLEQLTLIRLASMIVHLVEYIETQEIADLNGAKGILNSLDVAKALTPNVLIPVMRSSKSVAEILKGIK